MMRPRTLDRYVALQFLRLWVLFALAAPVLFILMDVTDHLDNYLDRGLTLRQVAISYVYQLPLFVLYALPVASLIATIFTVNGMTRHSEVAAAKAGGISFYRLFAPLAVLGLLLTGVALGLSELVPVTNRLRAEVLGQRRSTAKARTDFVYRARDGHVLSVRRLDGGTGRMFGLSLEREGNEPAVPVIHVVAREATYDQQKGRWMLSDGYLRMLLDRGVERSFRFSRMLPLHLRESPEQLLAEPKDPEEMRYGELGQFIETLQRSGGRPLELMVKREQKIAIPVATFIVIIFAAPLATSAGRGGAAYGIGIALGITIFYLMLFKITGALGAGGALSPMVAAWLPNAVFLAAAIGMAARVKT